MAKLIPLFSGSSGNSAYIGGAGGGILIDAGVSAKRLACALASIGVDPGRVGAVFVTHEHIDHVRGLRVFCERHGVPVFATPGTLRALERMGALAAGMRAGPMPSGGVEAGGLLLRSFATSHDAADPCGYACEAEGGEKYAVATDTGYLAESVKAALRGCDTVMLESNHEVTMLQNGPYPYPRKRRILSDQGHLSNAACADFLPALLRAGAGRFYLAHLSRENNTPQLAYACARAAFDQAGAREGIDYELRVCAP
ncbi:MAG: MBL fold metallo-hydrolase [Oscillospiraceae bacterium]|nr:MBL fold metallo-hydrolase [Oscillospiraceae bacterium]